MSEQEQVKKDGAEPEENEGGILDEIRKKCLDSGGYIIFCGVLTPQKDKDGNRMISFSYRRYHFPYEDAAKAIGHFRRHVEKDFSGRF